VTQKNEKGRGDPKKHNKRRYNPEDNNKGCCNPEEHNKWCYNSKEHNKSARTPKSIIKEIHRNGNFKNRPVRNTTMKKPRCTKEDENKEYLSEIGCGLGASGSKQEQVDGSCKCSDKN